jgi:hypothetical protein
VATLMAVKIEPMASISGMMAATALRKAMSMNVKARTKVTKIMMPKSSWSILSSSFSIESLPAMTISKPAVVSSAFFTVSMMASTFSMEPPSVLTTIWARRTCLSSETMPASPVS